MQIIRRAKQTVMTTRGTSSVQDLFDEFHMRTHQVNLVMMKQRCVLDDKMTDLYQIVAEEGFTIISKAI